MHPLVAKTLEVAAQNVGVREVPLGSNRGPQVEKILRSCGLGPGNPWCLAFCYYCAHTASEALGIPNPLLRSGYCPYLSAWSKEEGVLFTQPQAGDVFLLYGRTRGAYRAHHAGLVAEVAGGRYGTIEGNTTLVSGSSEGVGVFKRERPVSSAYRFVRWGQLIPALEVPVYRLLIGGREVDRMPIQQNRALANVKRFCAALGVPVSWSQENQHVLIGGKEVPAQVALIDNEAVLPIRELVEFVGLQLRVNAAARTVEVYRA